MDGNLAPAKKKKRKTAAEKRAIAAAKAAVSQAEAKAVSLALAENDNGQTIAVEVHKTLVPKKKRKTAAERREAAKIRATAEAETASKPVSQGPKISQWLSLFAKDKLTDAELATIENDYVIPSEVMYDPRVELERTARRKLATLAFQQRSVQQSLASIGGSDIPVLDEFFPSPEAILVAADRLSRDAAVLRQVKGKADKTHVQLDRMSAFLIAWHKFVTAEVRKTKVAIGYSQDEQ